MLDIKDIMETVTMIQDDHLDIRTITMGISLLDCANSDIGNSCNKIYEKICRKAENLVAAGEEIEKKYGIREAHELPGSCDALRQLHPFVQGPAGAPVRVRNGLPLRDERRRARSHARPRLHARRRARLLP